MRKREREKKEKPDNVEVIYNMAGKTGYCCEMEQWFIGLHIIFF